MKKTMNVVVANEKEYTEFTKVLANKGFKQIGTRLFEDDSTYIRINIEF